MRSKTSRWKSVIVANFQILSALILMHFCVSLDAGSSEVVKQLYIRYRFLLREANIWHWVWGRQHSVDYCLLMWPVILSPMFQEGLNAKSPLEHGREDQKILKLLLLKQENCENCDKLWQIVKIGQQRERERERERSEIGWFL